MPNKKTAAQRQPYVDAMKGFGILCVVIGHFIEYHRGTAPGINALFTCIYLFHMAIFAQPAAWWLSSACASWSRSSYGSTLSARRHHGVPCGCPER